MEVRYKRHQNKITSTDTEIINHILQITCEDLEESLLQWQKKESQWDVSNNKRDFDFKEQWFVENWMTEKINPEREETNSHKKKQNISDERTRATSNQNSNDKEKLQRD